MHYLPYLIMLDEPTFIWNESGDPDNDGAGLSDPPDEGCMTTYAVGCHG